MSGAPPAARRAVDLAGLRIPERTLPLLRDLVESRIGIHYEESRLDVLRDRLTPLAIDRGFDSLLDYYYALKYDTDDLAAWPRVMDALSVQETYFWREPDQFDALARHMLPRIAAVRPGPIRIWSVPCASGEEPLSIAMALESAGAFSQYTIEIHASDASDRALERARDGCYGERSFRQLSTASRDRFFTQDSSGKWKIAESLRRRITSWSRINVVDPQQIAPYAGSDVIFCRNLFIYFTVSTMREVVNQFAAAMPSPAFLCVGSAESLLRLATPFELQDIGGAYVYVKS